jgi:hypothetical protein
VRAAAAARLALLPRLAPPAHLAVGEVAGHEGLAATAECRAAGGGGGGGGGAGLDQCGAERSLALADERDMRAAPAKRAAQGRARAGGGARHEDSLTCAAAKGRDR